VTLIESAHEVATREDLVAFLKALNADFAANRGAWGNARLETFLEAMAAWSEDMDGYYESRGESLVTLPAWRVLADILVAARVYE
jgi:hypothetical protein